MCTAMKIQSPLGEVYFGRTMDFSYPLDPELYIVAKGYRWHNILNTHEIRSQYSFMGIGQDISPLIFADGVNEMGFAAAVLYFPGYAHYDTADLQDTAKPSIAALELVKFLLGLSASVSEAVSLLQTIRIVGVKDAVTNSVAPLHFIITDKSGKCAVIEKTADGLQIMDNPVGVLSNSPDFQWHMTNLRNYMEVTPYQQQEREWSSVKLTPFGQGGGTFGLPGDYTPPSRFVRTAYLKSHVIMPSDKKEAVNTCFHVMESVSIPKGGVMTDRDTADYTQYTAFINANTMEYFFKTYDNSQIVTAGLMEHLDNSMGIQSLGKLRRPILFEEWKNGD